MKTEEIGKISNEISTVMQIIMDEKFMINKHEQEIATVWYSLNGFSDWKVFISTFVFAYWLGKQSGKE